MVKVDLLINECDIDKSLLSFLPVYGINKLNEGNPSLPSLPISSADPPL